MPNFCGLCGAKQTPTDQRCAQCGAAAGPAPSAPSFSQTGPAIGAPASMGYTQASGAPIPVAAAAVPMGQGYQGQTYGRPMNHGQLPTCRSCGLQTYTPQNYTRTKIRTPMRRWCVRALSRAPAPACVCVRVVCDGDVTAHTRPHAGSQFQRNPQAKPASAQWFRCDDCNGGSALVRDTAYSCVLS